MAVELQNGILKDLQTYVNQVRNAGAFNGDRVLAIGAENGGIAIGASRNAAGAFSRAIGFTDAAKRSIAENNETRSMFLHAVGQEFNGIKNIPEAVRRALRLTDYGLRPDGNDYAFTSGKPLTERRISAVIDAIVAYKEQNAEPEELVAEPEPQQHGGAGENAEPEQHAPEQRQPDPQPVPEAVPEVPAEEIAQPPVAPVDNPNRIIVPEAAPAEEAEGDVFDLAYYRGKLAEMETRFPVVRNYASQREFANLQAHMARARFILDLLEHDLGNVVVKNTHEKIKTEYVVMMQKPDDYEQDEALKAQSVDVGNGQIAVAYSAHRAGLVLQRLAQSPNHYAEYNTLDPLPGTHEIPDDKQARLHFMTYAGGLFQRYVMSVVDPFTDTFGTERFKEALGVYNAPINGKCIELNTNAIEGERMERGLMRIGGANGEQVIMNFADTNENDELFKCIDLEVGFIVRNHEASGEDWSELAPILAKRYVGLTRMINGVAKKVTVADIEDCRNKLMAGMFGGDENDEDLDAELEIDIAKYAPGIEKAIADTKKLQAEKRVEEAKKYNADMEGVDLDQDELMKPEDVNTVYDGALELLESAKKALESLAKLNAAIVPNPLRGNDVNESTFVRVAKFKKPIDWSKPRPGYVDLGIEKAAGVKLTRNDFDRLMRSYGIQIDYGKIRYREDSPYFAGQCLRYAQNVIKSYVRTIAETFADAFGTEKQDFMFEAMNARYANVDLAIKELENVHTGPAFLEKKIFEAAFGPRPTAQAIQVDDKLLDAYEEVAPAGKVEKTENSFEFKGIVFRADSRSFNVVRAHGLASPQKVEGFSSQQDLSNPENLKEAMGVGKALGATGQSGVSCSQTINKCIGYATAPMGNSFSYVYVIDTTKLAPGEHAWDMDSVYTAGGGKSEEKTGAEVNASSIRKEAVMGWIKVPREVADYEDADPEHFKVARLRRYCLEHPTAIEANPDYAK